MLVLRDVTKIFSGPVPALQGVTMSLSHGLYGLLGANGAGKTTLMQIISGLLEPTSGDVELDGKDIVRRPEAIWSSVGYLPQELGFYDDLSGEQMLIYLLRIKGVGARDAQRTARELLTLVNLSVEARRAVRTYSGGMRRRLGLAQAIAVEPRVILLDEPTAGLDPEERQRFHHLLVRLGRDRIVVLSTHIVEDVAALCARFGVLASGRLVLETTPTAARASLAGALFEGDMPEGGVGLPDHVVVTRVLLTEGRARVRVFKKSGTEPPGFAPVAPTLEDAYFLASKAQNAMFAAGSAAA
jgi:ABC-type multidrug transport system ATPase subunit